MSARTLLLEELARAPEGVAQQLLAHLRGLIPAGKQREPAAEDYFDSYWSQLYGSLEGKEWNEPPELPFENREAW